MHSCGLSSPYLRVHVPHTFTNEPCGHKYGNVVSLHISKQSAQPVRVSYGVVTLLLEEVHPAKMEVKHALEQDETSRNT